MVTPISHIEASPLNQIINPQMWLSLETEANKNRSIGTICDSHLNLKPLPITEGWRYSLRQELTLITINIANQKYSKRRKTSDVLTLITPMLMTKTNLMLLSLSFPSAVNIKRYLVMANPQPVITKKHLTNRFDKAAVVTRCISNKSWILNSIPDSHLLKSHCIRS